MHNLNEAEEDAFGRAKRSSTAANQVGAGVLGALRVVGLNGTYAGVEFNIGTGFDAADRATLWDIRGALPGQVVKFKFQRIGADEKPRFPTWLGFRANEDA
jgi:DNA ligase-1